MMIQAKILTSIFAKNNHNFHIEQEKVQILNLRKNHNILKQFISI